MPIAKTPLPLVAGIAGAALLSACTAPAVPAAPPSSNATPSTASATATPTAGGHRREVAQVSPRVVYSHEAGLTMLDATSGKVVHEEQRPGFLRLSDAGDGQHVFVTEGDRFLVYDTGIKARPHGDHAHYYENDPGLTAQTYDMPHAGHVVAHGGWTTLFSDGTGDIISMPSDRVVDPGALAKRFRTDTPHHGVALLLADDALLTTQGTEKERHTVQVKAGDQVRAETTDCPGIHGEAAAQPTEKGDVVLIGCTNGPVVYRDGAFHKVSAPDAYARTGNSAGSPVSPVVLTDYKTDKDATLERPTRVALVDTRSDRMKLVELGSSYWFRSLARGPEGEALVLTYDGHVKVIDPATGKVTGDIPAIQPWTEKERWQDPGPSIKVVGDEAYVTDAAHNKLVVVDLHDKSVVRSFDLAHAPVEIAVATGVSAEDAEAAHGSHGHEG